MKGSKGQGWFAPVFGIPFIFLVILILLGLAVFLGVAFMFKNIIWIALFVGALYIGYILVKQRRLNGSMFIGLIVILITVWVLGNVFGLLAMGIQNQKASVSISTGNEQLLAYGTGSSDNPQESKFSFTCMSPLAETVGCRLAPYTYRPVHIKICNKDPELPIPPSIVLVTVDGHPLQVNEKITLNGIKDDWGSKVKPGDVFLAPMEKERWWDDVGAWMKGEKPITYMGKKYVVFYITKPIPKGACVEFGKNSNGKDTLFLVASKGAKINSNHILQVALVETTGSDKILSLTENQIAHAGDWAENIPIIGGALSGLSQGFVKLVLFPVQAIANYFSTNAERTVYAVGAYKFLVAYPYVEVFIVLGIIGVIGLAVTKLMRIW